jgi:hypothetical protein
LGGAGVEGEAGVDSRVSKKKKGQSRAVSFGLVWFVALFVVVSVYVNYVCERERERGVVVWRRRRAPWSLLDHDARAPGAGVARPATVADARQP